MSHSADQRDGSRRLDEGCPMTEDEKLRFILIVSAMVAALAVHRFLETRACPQLSQMRAAAR